MSHSILVKTTSENQEEYYHGELSGERIQTSDLQSEFYYLTFIQQIMIKDLQMGRQKKRQRPCPQRVYNLVRDTST